jgi:hypothetical protein
LFVITVLYSSILELFFSSDYLGYINRFLSSLPLAFSNYHLVTTIVRRSTSMRSTFLYSTYEWDVVFAVLHQAYLISIILCSYIHAGANYRISFFLLLNTILWCACTTFPLASYSISFRYIPRRRLLDHMIILF